LADLIPFWKTQSTYWKSTDVVNGTSLNYTYPDLLDDATPSDVSRGISQRYSGSPYHPPSSASSQTSNTITEWTVRVHCKQFELGGSFSILFFIGHVPEDPSEWHVSPTLAGTFDAIVNNTPEECANCRNQEDMTIAGYVHLNSRILRHYDQAMLHPEYVVPRLTSDLSWRVLKVRAIEAEPARVLHLLLSPR
jgi:tyrosinase